MDADGNPIERAPPEEDRSPVPDEAIQPEEEELEPDRDDERDRRRDERRRDDRRDERRDDAYAA